MNNTGISQVKVTLDGETGYIPGGILEERWNGFLVPWFDRETAEVILRDLEEHDKNFPYEYRETLEETPEYYMVDPWTYEDSPGKYWVGAWSLTWVILENN